MLEIKDLYVKIAEEDREILKGLSLKLPKGEVHAIMGPNGSGKSTLAYVLAGRDNYEVTQGDILWNGEFIATIDELLPRLAGIAGSESPVLLKVLPNKRAPYARVAQVQKTLKATALMSWKNSVPGWGT